MPHENYRNIGIFASIFLAFVVTGCQDIQKTIEQKESGVFLIMNQNTDPATKDQKGAIGTGFFVGPDQIITNAHVVEKIIENGEQKLFVKLENSDKYEVEVTNIDTGIDLALLTDEKIQLIVKRGDKKMNINISPLYKTSKELTQ